MSEQNIVNISEANLQQTLQQSMNVPVLFYFWSARSQHCEQLTPVLERLAAQYNGQFTLAKVDCDAEQMLASQFGLRAIPERFICSRTASRWMVLKARSRKKRSAPCWIKSCPVKRS